MKVWVTPPGEPSPPDEHLEKVIAKGEGTFLMAEEGEDAYQWSPLGQRQ